MDKNQPNHDKARNYALRLLKVRLRSKNELKERLRKRGYSTEQIEEVILELERAKLIDDERFATFFASDQLEFHVKGPRYVRYKLKMLGVEDSLIEKALREVFENADLKKIFYRFVRNHRFKSQQDILRILVKRGFDTEIVHKILLAIYEDWRCEDESGNNAHIDIRSDSYPGSDTGISSGENKRAERTEKSERKRK